MSLKIMKDDQFWLEWGSTNEQYFTHQKHTKFESYRSGEFLHRLTFEDWKGRVVEAVFEAHTHSLCEVPTLGLRLRSLVRADTNESITEIGERVYMGIYEEAMSHISQSEKELLDNVPAW